MPVKPYSKGTEINIFTFFYSADARLRKEVSRNISIGMNYISEKVLAGGTLDCTETETGEAHFCRLGKGKMIQFHEDGDVAIIAYGDLEPNFIESAVGKIEVAPKY